MKSRRISSTKLVLLSLLMALVLGLSPSWLPFSPQPTTSTVEAALNPYNLGLGYFQNNVGLSDDAMWLKAKEVAHLAYIQSNWQEALNTGGASFYDAVSSQISLARSNGMKIYLGLNMLSADRTALQLPTSLQGLSGGFNNTTIRDSYVETVRKVATDFRPDYFVIADEINMYKSNNATDFNAYKGLYATAYQAIKAASPQTQVAVSLAYLDFNGVNCIDTKDKNVFKSHVADFNSQTNVSDMFAVSTYPFCYFKPSSIPANFLTQLAAFSSRPLFIAETGWMSDTFQPIPQFTFPSNPTRQAEFVDRLSTLVENARGRGYKVSAVTYISVVDPDSSYCAAIKQAYPQLGWYCTLALLDKQGAEKPAFGRMKAWKTRLGG